MPNYLVLEDSYINEHMVRKGEVVKYEGEAGSNLELMQYRPPGRPKMIRPEKDKDEFE